MLTYSPPIKDAIKEIYAIVRQDKRFVNLSNKVVREYIVTVLTEDYSSDTSTDWDSQNKEYYVSKIKRELVLVYLDVLKKG